MRPRLFGAAVALLTVTALLAGACASEDAVQLHPWHVRQSPQPADDRIPIAVLGGGCYADTEEVVRVEVDETSQQVEIGAYIEKQRAEPDQACPAVGTTHDVTVDLEAPLGDRELVDAACEGRRAHPQCASAE